MRSPVRAFMVLDIRDQLRDRSALLMRLLPVLVIAGGAVFGVALDAAQGDDEQERRRLVIEAAAPLDAALLAELDAAGLDVEAVADAAAAVADGEAEAGLVAAADGEGVEVVLREDSAGSAATGDRLLAALAVHDVRVNPVPSELALRVAEVDPSTSKVRELLSIAVPPTLLLLASGALGGSASQWDETKRGGRIAFQLTLPVRRSRLLIGKAAAEVVLTAVATAPILLLLTAAVGAVVWIEAGAGAAALSIAGLVGVALLSMATFAIGGLLVGLRWPSADSSNLLALPALIGVGLVTLFAVTEGDPPAAVALVPVAGVAESLRAQIAGELAAGLAAGSLAVALATLMALLRLAATARTDDLGLRPR